jgi:hypothetical protein
MSEAVGIVMGVSADHGDESEGEEEEDQNELST